ncbi:tetratricopeptide repeat protein [Sorangium sp. So ce1036]|uniref:tetratricopeptide repeat protein n=1 Tax=Sorangium sp. So ce1036 TaxID=3133328 RepID=UPI003F104718
MTPPGEARDRALDLLRRGDMAGGIAGLEGHLAAEPGDGGAWLALGAAYATLDRWADAAPALARAVERGGDAVEARLAHARALVRIGQLDGAASALQGAAAIAPADPRVLRELGVVLYDQRRYDEAAAWLARACEAAPGDARAAFALGLAHEARRDIAAAIAAYREAVRRAPGFIDARLTLADALASIGEHEQARIELEALLARERSHERAARNREVLRRALAEMRARRLLGKTERELARSALVVEAQLARRETLAPPVSVEGGGMRRTVRYTAPLLELHVTLDAGGGPGGGAIEALHLALTDPDRAARAEDDVFKVTVIGEDGRQAPVSYATGASLTFLREALGCPMTQASALYTSLLQGSPSVDWGGATLRFASVPGTAGKPGGERHGILVSQRG